MENALHGADVWGCGWQLGPVENVSSDHECTTHAQYITQYAMIL